jgi:hypothetical protein
MQGRDCVLARVGLVVGLRCLGGRGDMNPQPCASRARRVSSGTAMRPEAPVPTIRKPGLATRTSARSSGTILCPSSRRQGERTRSGNRITSSA